MKKTIITLIAFSCILLTSCETDGNTYNTEENTTTTTTTTRSTTTTTEYTTRYRSTTKNTTKYKSDGKVRDLDGDGNVDNKEWAKQWNDYLNKQYDKYGV